MAMMAEFPGKGWMNRNEEGKYTVNWSWMG